MTGAGLPRYVAIGNNPRAGLVHQAGDGCWRANNWQGCLGGFETEADAVAAIYAAPAAPKRKRKPKADPPDLAADWRLSDPDSGGLARDRNGRAIGAVRPAAGRFEAWAHGGRLGEYPSSFAARAAVARAVGTK